MVLHDATNRGCVLLLLHCRAGNDATRAKSLGVSADCTERCTSAPTGDCGGTLANTVYAVGSSRPALAPAAARGFAFVGCFKDNIADRGLPRLLETDVGMTVERCARLAQKAGYTVFGVQWAQSCYAGESSKLRHRVHDGHNAYWFVVQCCAAACGCTLEHNNVLVVAGPNSMRATLKCEGSRSCCSSCSSQHH